MICKNCGGETSTVLCEHCGINVVWYNKYGILQNETEPEKITDSESGDDISDNIDDILSEMFIPDGSGD